MLFLSLSRIFGDVNVNIAAEELHAALCSVPAAKEQIFSVPHLM